MGADNKMKSTKNNKKNDGKFHSKKIKHDPSAESARAVNIVNRSGNNNIGNIEVQK